MIRIVVPVVLTVMMAGAVVSADSLKFGGPVDVAEPHPGQRLVRVAREVCRQDDPRRRHRHLRVHRDGLLGRRQGSPESDQTVRFQAEHDGKIVFPITLKGKAGSSRVSSSRLARTTTRRKKQQPSMRTAIQRLRTLAAVIRSRSPAPSSRRSLNLSAC